MNNNYLIPANSKKSMLIFGLFTSFDLILFGSGIGLTFILLLVLNSTSNASFLALIPAGVTGFLVLPVPNYHNILTILKEIYRYFTERRNFIWKGWCFNHEDEK